MNDIVMRQLILFFFCTSNICIIKLSTQVVLNPFTTSQSITIYQRTPNPSMILTHLGYFLHLQGSSLYTKKHKSKIQSVLIFRTVLLLSSKHLAFLSFQMVHHIQDGVVLQQLLFFAPFPSSSHLDRVSTILLGIVHCMPLSNENIPQLVSDSTMQKQMNHCLRCLTT